MAPSVAWHRPQSSSESDFTPKQIRQELSKLELRATSAADTIASLQHDRDRLKNELMETVKVLTETKAKAAAAERAQEGLANHIWGLRKQVEAFQNARFEDTAASKRHISAADTLTSKLNKLWLRVDEMEKKRGAKK